MPVDLSKVGLEGIRAGQNTLDQIANRRAQAVDIEAKQFELENDRLDRALGQQAAAYMEAINRGETPPPDLFGSQGLPEDFNDRSAPFDILASVYARGGMPGKAMEFAKAASTLDKQDQEINSAEFTDTKTRLDNYMKTAEIVASTLGNAQNDSEWEYAKAEISRQPAVIKVLGEDNWRAIADMNFDPDVAALFRERAMTEYQKYSLEQRANYQNRMTSNAEARTRIAERRLAIAEANAAEARRQKALKAKGAKDGKSAEAPDAQQIKGVKALIVSEVFNGTMPKNQDALEAGAFSIASRANQLIRANEALSWESAVQRAIIESKANKEWDTEDADDMDSSLFKSQGLKFSTALPAPQDPAQLRNGYYYKRPDGEVFRFMNGKFIRVRIK